MYQEGSVLELIQRLAPYRAIALGIFLGLPILTWVVGLSLKRVSRQASAWFLTIPIHLTVLPGMAMAVLVTYTLFFSRLNLLAQYDVVFFFGPILAMVLTCIAAGKVLPFEDIPGFARLGGMMFLAALAFVVVLILDRMYFAAIFRVSPLALIATFAALYIAFEVGMAKISRRRERY